MRMGTLHEPDIPHMHCRSIRRRVDCFVTSTLFYTAEDVEYLEAG